MDEIRSKLANCFSAAFPQLDPSQYSTASAENVAGWDSLAQVTLLTLIGEEFEIDINFEEFEGITSFEGLVSQLAESIDPRKIPPLGGVAAKV